MKEVLFWLSFSVSSCHYCPSASTVEKTAALPRVSMHSSMRGIGYTSCLVTLFSLQWWKQKRREPSPFGANTIGAAHPVWGGLITLSNKISQTLLFTAHALSGLHGTARNGLALRPPRIAQFNDFQYKFGAGDSDTSTQIWIASQWISRQTRRTPCQF